MTEDARLIAAQLGREPRGQWRVVAHCSHERPTVIASAPRLDDGAPFPTLYWLTCPHLVESVNRLESEGRIGRWTERIAADPRMQMELLASDQQYRAAREMEGEGDDPCAGTGIAGMDDPRLIKCLHAHVATFLAGIPDPVGRGTLAGLESECTDDTCRAFLELPAVRSAS